MTDYSQAMNLARWHAQFSPDPSKKNGAVLLDAEARLISTGINTFPVRVVQSPARWERPTKYQYVEHAERNAIYEAAKHGCCSNQGTLVAVWAACADCARAIIQAGVRRLVRVKSAEVIPYDDHDELDRIVRWAESIAVGDQMMLEAGVEIIEIP